MVLKNSQFIAFTTKLPHGLINKQKRSLTDLEVPTTWESQCRQCDQYGERIKQRKGGIEAQAMALKVDDNRALLFYQGCVLLVLMELTNSTVQKRKIRHTNAESKCSQNKIFPSFLEMHFDLTTLKEEKETVTQWRTKGFTENRQENLLSHGCTSRMLAR